VSSLCMHCHYHAVEVGFGRNCQECNGLAMSRTRMRREPLARWSLSQHHIFMRTYNELPTLAPAEPR